MPGGGGGVCWGGRVGSAILARTGLTCWRGAEREPVTTFLLKLRELIFLLRAHGGSARRNSDWWALEESGSRAPAAP